MVVEIPQDEQMLKVGEVAQELGITERQAYHLAQSGQIDAFKLGAAWRIMRSDLERYRAQIEGRSFDDSMPEGAVDLREAGAWLRYSPSHLRRLALNGTVRSHKTPMTGKRYFFKEELLEDLRGKKPA